MPCRHAHVCLGGHLAGRRFVTCVPRLGSALLGYVVALPQSGQVHELAHIFGRSVPGSCSGSGFWTPRAQQKEDQRIQGLVSDLTAPPRLCDFKLSYLPSGSLRALSVTWANEMPSVVLLESEWSWWHLVRPEAHEQLLNLGEPREAKEDSGWEEA